MKISINLLPPQPEVENLKTRRRTALFWSSLLLLGFLIFNLAIFGFYLFLTKNTAETKASVKQEEEKLVSLAENENLYRSLAAKLGFLLNLWQKKVQAQDLVNFSQTLVTSGTTIERIGFKQTGLVNLAVTVDSSANLEQFLDNLKSKEKSGNLKSLKLNSTAKNDKGGYDLVLNFEFLKP